MNDHKTLPAGWMAADDRARTVDERSPQDQLEGLYRAHAEALHRYISRIYGVSTADDLTQEAWGRLFQRLLAGDRIEHPRAWLMIAARNVFINGLKAERYDATDPEVLTGLARTTRTPEDAAIDRDAVRRALRWLTPLEQELLLARHRGLSYREIAERVELDLQQVVGIIRRAVARVKGRRHA